MRGTAYNKEQAQPSSAITDLLLHVAVYYPSQVTREVSIIEAALRRCLDSALEFVPVEIVP